MKKTNILMTLVLLFAASVSLQAQKYTVKQRVGLQDANVNGSVSATPQNPEAGTTVQVTCTPNGGFGLVRGVFYAVKDANGEYGETKMAKNTSEYKEDLANPQNFTFTMPHGNVEIWAYFDSTRVMVIHDAPEGKLEPVYGRREHKPKNEVYNVPHGRACTAFAPAFLERAGEYRPDLVPGFIDAVGMSMEELCGLIRDLTDVRIAATVADIQKFYPRWEGKINSFVHSPGGFTADDAAKVFACV